VRLTETVARELQTKGYAITVNAVAPGAVCTSMTEEILMNRDLVGEKEFLEAVETVRTGGTPKELLIEFFIFLASSESDGISGKLISALWDDWRHFPNQYVELSESSLYNLRRIDNRRFYERMER